jgi:serine/threonine protein kinase
MECFLRLLKLSFDYANMNTGLFGRFLFFLRYPRSVMSSEKKHRPGSVRLSAARVKEKRLEKKLSVEELIATTFISYDTWKNISNEKHVSMATAKKIADLLTNGDLRSLLHPSVLAGLAADYGPETIASGLPDWEPVEPLSGCTTTSNGLRYYAWKMRHRQENNRLARGKCYDLALLPTMEQQRLINYLVRHGHVCNMLSRHPRFPLHVTTTPDPQRQAWWVVDEWTPGRTFDDALRHKDFPVKNIPRIMREIADGLKALHDVEIIRRELSPRFIILRESDNAVVLTDFELGKLFDGSPTARTEFPCDPYRAPEGGGELTLADRNVDLYSWGRICVHAVTGREPPKPGKEEPELQQAKLPSKVQKIILRCVSLKAEKRPQSVEEVQKAISDWE